MYMDNAVSFVKPLFLRKVLSVKVFRRSRESASIYVTKNIIHRNHLPFGIKELVNRYIFVTNNKLSKKYFLTGLNTITSDKEHFKK